ncbi:MAG: aspartyl protease family protein, partial [Phycisphaerales bacterium]
EEGAGPHTEAIKGLVMVYYQTNQYVKSRMLKLPGEDDGRGSSSLLTSMQRFEGKPYQIEWATPDKVAHLPIVNDFTPAGALPEMKLEINGHPVQFILDTGGDRLYIDEDVAKKVGIRHIAKRQSRYAYTKGDYVDEPLGVADSVKMGEVTLKNVPVIVAKWKAMGITSDGVVTTQMLKQFLSTVDYENKRMTFRERSDSGLRQLLGSFGGEKPHRLPFFMKGTHLMYAKGSLNGRQGLNMFVDSGLGAAMSLVILDETVEFLGIEKNDIEGTKYYWSPIKSHGIGDLTRGATQALGNVIVEEDPYWRHGFIFDALISHQYLRHLGSWTIDFDTMTYYFPARALDKVEPEQVSSPPAGGSKAKLENPETYVGSYEVAPGMALEVTTAEGILFLQAPGQQKVPMAAEADGTFSIALAGAKIVFERDGSGAVTGLVLHQAGHQTPAKKRQP